MLLVLDSVKVRAHFFRPKPVEPDVAQKSAVLVPLDRRCAARVLFIA